MPTVRQVTCTASELCCSRYSDANCKASNWYCIRVSAVGVTVMQTVRQVTGTASELVLLELQ
jgi:hypothetical protein